MPQFEAAQPNVYADWGRLVMSWATGQDFQGGDPAKHFDTPLPGSAYNDPTTTRATVAQFNAVATGTASVQFPPTVKYIIFVRDTPDTRYVRLPDPTMIDAAYQMFSTDGAGYSLPPFYVTAPLNPSPGNVVRATDKLLLQAERVGDYSIGSCA